VLFYGNRLVTTEEERTLGIEEENLIKKSAAIFAKQGK
jgi:hypothetical protein